MEILSTAFIVLFLENSKLFYILLLFCLHIGILAGSSLFKCPIAIKCSESRVETLQNFLNVMRFFVFGALPFFKSRVNPEICNLKSKLRENSSLKLCVFAKNFLH